MQGVRAHLSELTPGIVKLWLKHSSRWDTGAIPDRRGGAAVPALVDSSPNLLNELESDLLILSEQTWETHQKAKRHVTK